MDTQSSHVERVHIVGGGFSGLVTAFYLQKQGLQVAVFEKESRLGGVIQTEHQGMGPVETAANAFLNTAELQSICAEIGCTLIHTLPQSRKRFFYRDGRLSRLPLKLKEIPHFIFKILRLLVKRDLKPLSGDSMYQWAERNFGKAAALHIVGTALNGIYSGDERSLSAELIVGPYFKNKAKSAVKVKRGSVAPYNGMGDFIKCLQSDLSNKGVEFYQSNIDAQTIQTWQNNGIGIILSVGAKAASFLLEKVAPDQSQQLRRIKTMPLVSAHVFWQKAHQQIDGFGVLVDDDARLRVLGVLANNRIFANRGTCYSETWIFGGARSPEVSFMSDHEIEGLILKEAKEIFKEDRKINSLYVHRWADVLPHYDFTLLDVLSQLKKTKGIYQIGNYTGRIGLSKILEQAKALAQEVVDDETKSRSVARQRGHSKLESQL